MKKASKQSVVSLLLVSGSTHTVLLANDFLETLIPNVTNLKTSKVQLTEVSPEVSIMGKQVQIDKENNGKKANLFLDGTNFATFCDRVAGMDIISTDAEATEDDRVILNDEDSTPSQSKDTRSIVGIEDDKGIEHLVIMRNQDVDTIFTRMVATSKAPVLQISSQNPQLCITANSVDYHDLGNGTTSGMFYLTGLNYSIYMNHFAGIRIIRPNVDVDANQFIVSKN